MIDQNGMARALEQHARALPANAPTVERMLELLRRAAAPFSRSSLDPGHFTASGFVLSPDGQRVLLVHHSKLARWLQPGGHVEPGDTDLAAAARREVIEETGVGLSGTHCGILDVDVHAIPARPKEGAHLHFDVRYAFVASDEVLSASPEVLGARWVELGGVAALTDEESVLRCIARLRALAASTPAR